MLLFLEFPNHFVGDVQAAREYARISVGAVHHDVQLLILYDILYGRVQLLLKLNAVHLIEPRHLALRLYLELLRLLRRHLRIRRELRLRFLLRIRELGVRLIDHSLQLGRLLLHTLSVQRTDMYLTAARSQYARREKNRCRCLTEIIHMYKSFHCVIL